MISNVSIRQVFLILIIAFLGILIFWQLKNYVSAFLGAYTLFILLRKWQIYLVMHRKWKASWAALLLILFSILVFVLPLNALLGMIAKRLIPLIQNYPQLLSSIEQNVHQIENQFHIEILTQENIRTVGDWAVKELQGMLGATFNGALGVALMFFILYFMLTEYKMMQRGLFKLLPISEKSVTYVKTHLNNLVFSNAVGIPLVALLQGVLGLIMYWILGIPDAMLWFVATCVAAVIPVLGAALVYVPLSILLFTQGAQTQGVVLLIYGFAIIGSADNVFRFWLQKKIGDTHPLITIFGVIVGLNLFGFIGLVFGPILFSLLILFFEIYNMEFSDKEVSSTSF
jgi:predicted PurR-regulated permease PerM